MIQKYTFAKVEREHGTRTYKNRQQDIFKSTFSIRIYYLSNILFMNLQRKIGIADTSHTINSSISDRVFASPPSSFQFDRSVFRNEFRGERNFRGIDACPASFRAIISAVVYHDGCFRRWISARRTVNTADTSFVRINNIAEIGINGTPL